MRSPGCYDRGARPRVARKTYEDYVAHVRRHLLRTLGVARRPRHAKSEPNGSLFVSRDGGI